MHAAFFHDGSGAAVFADGVARQVEVAHIALRDLLLVVVAHHAHAVQLQRHTGLGQLALQRPHHAGKGRDGGEAVRQRAGNGIGVLNAQVGEDEDGLGLRHGVASVAVWFSRWRSARSCC